MLRTILYWKNWYNQHFAWEGGRQIGGWEVSFRAKVTAGTRALRIRVTLRTGAPNFLNRVGAQAQEAAQPIFLKNMHHTKGTRKKKRKEQYSEC